MTRPTGRAMETRFQRDCRLARRRARFLNLALFVAGLALGAATRLL